MPSVEGRILLVQEGRFRLLDDRGRGAVFLLAPDAPLEPQDLPPLTGRRVRVTYERTRDLMAGVVRDLRILPNPGGR